MFQCKTIGDEGGCWQLTCPITSLQIDLGVYEQSYTIITCPYDLHSVSLDRNTYIHESALFALTELGGKTEEMMAAWAGEPWSAAKWRWDPKHIDGRGRN